MAKNLTYAVITFNKLSYLKIIITKLIKNVIEDEEIIVIDGGSSDGTVEYLKELKDGGLIKNYISEKDKGEAHACNKALLAGESELIKMISDDDAFCFPAINICKKYMLQHPEIDVLASNTAVTYANNYKKIEIIKDYQEGFIKWRDNKILNFAFCMTPIIIRKSSLPLTGLLYIKSKIPDFEWTIRITGFANIAWYTGFPVVNIINNLSSSANSYNVFKVWPEEWERFVHFYKWIPPKKIMRNYPLLPPSLKIKLTRFNLKNSYKLLKRKIVAIPYGLCLKLGFIKKKQTIEAAGNLNFESIFQECHNWLNDKNQNSDFEFLQK
jgi:glycosyltransferase involved in cell wall biosynthesis